MAGRVDGKVAFITGAARGQGRSHAVRLAEEGADIIAVDLCAEVETTDYAGATPDDLAETVAMVEKVGRRIVAAEADVRDTESLRAALDRGVAELGRLDIVVANAGILSNGPSHELTEQTWGEMIDINLSGVWRTCKVAIPHLVATGDGGSVILVSSVAGLRSYSGVSHYVSAKHGVVGLMKTLAQELAPHRVRVNTVNPTQVDTPMIQNESMYHLFCPDIPNPTREDFGKASSDTILLPIDWVESIDVSNAVLFLASEEARYITGVALPIDAGALVL
ncbi:mycofactocin-coupled SDR family oxidoreductase [Frankia sp. CNm7]|uniref:Mycofactocin-coupled SDR family oxidoreductase n=1 Tax=Frankia nepalensis TaxID=1836974 RepID=A0A937RNH0_9ACTN|nr:mycofactocin-coupled SDR family oxidoreductase [Frankia nepalensis]MBL7498831.1 mycofactocin-coupled SDR family oxidoreductase [Frankia nepalensis]MBL7508636.1 mycofactocin-coupled SDR family oxidoreductase [Frankia nepalensis]MBL7519273.1 mycofactocin-coupled SDR family oxidoreductase [Frankia nepalensis]MBL7629693.1 mycofactocin-coupled SDR family oxidoreductase [Frankia nepalensis]